ncbi:hypothetical protein DOY81_011809 [Sarcophaga bullata]|nr:hypothetical protein DOY81_011809 [Sarcophaga bullata]
MENNDELIDELLSDTEIITAGTTNTEMPVLENLFTAEAGGTNVSVSEIVKTPLKLNEQTDDSTATLPEKRWASKLLPQNPETKPVTPNVTENTTDIADKPPIENISLNLDPNLEKENQTEAPKQTEVPINIDAEKTTKNPKVDAEDLLETPVEELCTPEVKTKETKESPEQNILNEIDNKSKETEKSSKDNENDKSDENKITEPKSSEMSDEPIDSQNESPDEINKNREQLVAENLKDVKEKSSIDAANETKENEILQAEEIEPMDTCDSQESLNLIIDETSNITENKDDLSDNNKTDDDTNMEVDIKEHSSAVIKESNDKGQDEKEKDEDEDALNKLKDDDVIPIEQPPVPIIEIDDEDDMEPTDSTKTLAKESEQKQTPMDVDEKSQTAVSEKEISSTH